MSKTAQARVEQPEEGSGAGRAVAGPPSRRSEVKRVPDRARYDRETVHAILDEGFVAHVAIAVDGQPFVIPMVYGRRGDEIYLHGSPASRLMRALRGGAELSLCVTHLDSLVLARSAFHTSVNYRSVAIFGRAREVTDAAEKLRALEAVVEHAVPGRWSEVRGPNGAEFHRTLVLAVSISEASAKVRTGPPVEEPEDLERDTWAGLIPMRVDYGEPTPDPVLRPGIEPGPDVRDYRRPGAGPPASTSSAGV